MNKTTNIIPTERIESRILLIRGKKVMIDTDLAELYGVTTKVLNQAVRRNINRFPADFLFKLSEIEKQEVVTNCDHLEKLKFSSVLPNAFSEHGAIMAASVLNSMKAIAVSVYVVRAFVKLRELITSTEELKTMFARLENRIDKQDETIVVLVNAIKQLMEPPDPKKKIEMGFNS